MSDLHEAHVAKDIGGTQTPGSGAGKRFKGDVLNDVLMVECKSTLADKITVTAGLLRATCREAKVMRRTPAVSVAFIRGDPEVATTLILDAVLYIYPDLSSPVGVAVESCWLDKNDVLSLSEDYRQIVTFKMQKGFPKIWRIGWAKDLPKDFCTNTAGNKKKRQPKSRG